MTQDEKIQDIALAYIRCNSMDAEQWQWTNVGALHPKLGGIVKLADGERVLVSAYIFDSSWYVFTSRRIESLYGGKCDSIDPAHIVGNTFPDFNPHFPDVLHKPETESYSLAP